MKKIFAKAWNLSQSLIKPKIKYKYTNKIWFNPESRYKSSVTISYESSYSSPPESGLPEKSPCNFESSGVQGTISNDDIPVDRFALFVCVEL